MAPARPDRHADEGEVFAVIFRVLLEIVQRDRQDVTALTREIRQLGVTMSAELDRLTAEVSESRTVMSSAIVLLEKLATLIRDNASNPEALNALADDLDSQQSELAEAVTANTPTP